ncbi:hypothetical protein AAHZ94_01640 [Streptomyces sp. HSW2009]|uniref:hypothetical protein n=1 Tax=Streptomyces sp. HSW2009 TaxID=3142890 RepID=UPI0032EC7115
MKDDMARSLASALDIGGGALAIQGGLVRGILTKWGGQAGAVAKFPLQATWGQDQAKDVRHRLGLLNGDPEYQLMMAAHLGLIKTWEWAEENREKFEKEVIESARKLGDEGKKLADQYAADTGAGAKGLAVVKGVAAYRRLKSVWDAKDRVKNAKALLEISEGFRGNYDDALKIFDKAKKGYTAAWKPMEILSKLKGLGWLNKAPGTTFLDRALVPVSFVTGAKEVFFPSHEGAYGTTDRVMGGVQVLSAGAVMAGWTSAAIAGSAIPVVGWVGLGVAGAYFLGSWAWDKWGGDVKAYAKKKLNETVKGVADFAERVVAPGPVKKLKKLKFW